MKPRPGNKHQPWICGEVTRRTGPRSFTVSILYVIKSAAYGVICTSEFNPVQSTFYDVSCLLHVTREFSLK